MGLGGGGCNTVDRLSHLDLDGVSLIAANTDAQALIACGSDEKVSLGEGLTYGLGSGGDPAVGRLAAEESFRELIASIKDADLLFLTAGMGGGTGSGAIEIAARIAHSLGIMTVAVVTLPFSFESGLRSFNAAEAVSRLRPFTDTLITIPNDRLVALVDDHTSLSTAFSMADDLLIRAIQGLSSIIRSEGILSVDISHVLRLMRQDGGCYISTGTAGGDGRVMNALHQALCHPLLEEIPLDHSAGLIVKFAGKISVFEIQEGIDYLRDQTSNEIEIITAVSEDDLLASADQVQVMVLVTGIGGIGVQKTDLKTAVVENTAMEEIREQAIPVSGSFPKVGFTPSEPVPDELEVPAFIRKGSFPLGI